MILVKAISKRTGEEIPMMGAVATDMEDAKRAVKYANSLGLGDVIEYVYIQNPSEEDCKNVKELVGGYVESEKTCQKNADRDEIISLYKEGSISGKEARNRLTILYGDDDEAIEDAIERMYQGDHYYDDDEDEDCDCYDDEADYEASIYDLADKIPDEDLREKIFYKLEQLGI